MHNLFASTAVKRNVEVKYILWGMHSSTLYSRWFCSRSNAERFVRMLGRCAQRTAIVVH